MCQSVLSSIHVQGPMKHMRFFLPNDYMKCLIFMTDSSGIQLLAGVYVIALKGVVQLIKVNW